MKLDPGEGFTYCGEFTRVVTAVGRSMVLGVQGVTVDPVILFMESAGGGPFQGEVPPPGQVRQSSPAVGFAVGPVGVETDDNSGVDGEEEIVV